MRPEERNEKKKKKTTCVQNESKRQSKELEMQEADR